MRESSPSSLFASAEIAVRALLRDPLWPPTALLLAAFIALKWLFFHATALPADAYGKPFLSWEFLRQMPQSATACVLGVALAVAVAARWRQAVKPWSCFAHAREIRAIVVVSAAVLAWPTALYPENLYFSQMHLIDRGLVAVWFGLLCWRPVFVAPFLIGFYVTSWQFEVPLSGYSWAATDLPKNLLVLASAAFLLSLYSRRQLGRPFLFCVLCLTAAHYWPSGFGKLRLGWLPDNHVELLLPATYANGWLAMLSVEQIESATRSLAVVRPVLKLFTLFVECGALIFLLRRGSALLLLCGWCLFHLGVFLLSGIGFWQWFVVDVCLLVIVWKSPVVRREFFVRSRFLVSVALIFTAPLWLRPSNLSWFDSPANYVFRFTAIGDSGNRYPLHCAFFAPYEYTFTESGFGAIKPTPMLSIYWGATSREIAEPLIEDGTADGFMALEQEVGTVRYREDVKEQVAAFLEVFCSNYNRRLKTGARPAAPLAPIVLWTHRRAGGYRGQEPIRRVDVHEVVSFFDGEHYQEIRDTPLMSVEIPPIE